MPTLPYQTTLAALAELICQSHEFQHLFVELEGAFARVRGIRKCFAAIQRALKGQMPQQLTDKWQATVSLDPQAVRDAFGPIPTDETRTR